MFNNVIVNVRKKLMYARNIGQGNSCPVECEYADIACRAGGDTSNHSAKITSSGKKVKRKSNK